MGGGSCLKPRKPSSEATGDPDLHPRGSAMLAIPLTLGLSEVYSLLPTCVSSLFLHYYSIPTDLQPLLLEGSFLSISKTGLPKAS